jgi:hypothetical protein
MASEKFSFCFIYNQLFSIRQALLWRRREGETAGQGSWPHHATQRPKVSKYKKTANEAEGAATIEKRM